MAKRTAVKARAWFGQQIALLCLLLISVGSAWGAEMVTNGAFSGSAGWTFSTATYDSTTGRSANGSAKLYIAARNTATAGTVTQSVSIPAGSVINAVALYSQLTTNYETAGDNISVDLRYEDATTVNIFSSGELTNSSWTVRNGAGVTLAQNVNQIIITMNTKAGNNAAANASLWVDDLSISYTASNNGTTPGAMTSFGATDKQISIQVAFTGDDDNDNSCVIAYGTTPGNYNFTAPAPVKGAGIYTTTVSGLTPNTPYYFQATFTDPDNTPGTVTGTFSTTPPLSDPLLHNSINLGAKYWSASSGWGVAGGQYGEFTCTTCHNRNTGNIKRVVGSIPATIGTAVVKPVTYRNVTAFGNDAGGHTTSQRICEVCHTQTTEHKYNQTTGDLNHKNANLTDCTSCHAHNKSFGASCNSCHGYPPINATLGTDGLASPATGVLVSGQAGAHATHVNVRGMTCETCHQGYTQNPMGNQTLEFGFNINEGTISGFKGTFNGGSFASKTPYSPYSSNSTYTGTTVNMATGNNNTCSNLYCHGGYAGSNGSLTVPSWTAGATAKGCGACHGVSQATPPTSGNHVRHTGTATGNMGIACSDCHGTLPANNAHVNGNVVTSLNPASKLRANATYKGFANQSSVALSYGACAVYCHSTVQNSTATAVATPTVTPVWGGAPIVSCDTSACHGNPPANANHSTHVNAGYECIVCHNAAGRDTAKHADYNIDVTFSGVAGSGTYSQSPNAPGNGFGTCSATYCHNGAASAPSWNGSSLPTDCTGCHGNEVTAATKLSGAHNAHLNNASQGGVFTCSSCHAPTITNPNNRTITNSISHVNGMLNYSGLYAGRNATCSNIYCHSTGKGTFVNPPTWASGTTLGCNGCHGTGGNTSGMPSPDAVGVNSHTKHLPTQDTTKCVYCHRTTVNGTNAIITGSQHINAARDVRFSKPNAFTNNSGAYNAGNRTCSTSYCHGTAASDAWGTAGPLACNKCHAGSNVLPGAHGIHYNTATVVTGLYGAAPGSSSQSATAYQFSCSACHGTDATKHANYPVANASDATIFFGFSSAGRGQNATNAYVAQATGSTDAAGFQWTTGGNGNCSATYCHSNARGSNGVSASVNWGITARDASCGTCHGNSTTTIAGSNPASTPSMLSGAHKAHISTVSTGGSFACTDCHADTLSGNTTIAANAYNKHVNKFINYSGRYAGKNKTCSTFYCHSNGKGGAPVTALPAWTSGTTLGCNGCHGSTGNASGMPTPDAVGVNSHTKHLPTQDTTKCVYCHRTTVNGTNAIITGSQHINAARDVRFSKPNAFTNNSGAYNAGNRTCSTSYCHGTAASDAWGTAGPLACNKCHAGSNVLPGAHGIHYNTATVVTGLYGAAPGSSSQSATAYQFSCSACHGTDAAKHANYPVADASDATIFFGFSSAGRGQNATNAYVAQATGSTDAAGFQWTTGGNGNCSATYCHSNARGSNGVSASVNWGITARDASCGTCHGNSTTTIAGSNPASTPNMLSGAHKAHIVGVSTGGGFGCVDCHATTVSSNTTIGTSRYNKHVNKFVDYSGLYAGKNKTCSNIYCHSTGRGTFVNPPTWASGTTLDCSGCHGSTSANLTSGSHNAHLVAGATCQNCHWNTTQANGTIVVVAEHISRTVGVNQGSTFKSAAVSFTGTTSCSAISCHSNGTSGGAAAATWGGTLKCDGCHPNLSAAHTVHANLNLSTGVTFYNYTAIKSTGSEAVNGVKYGFGCGTCHPLVESTYHMDGSVEVQLDPATVGAGALRQKNGVGAIMNGDKSCDMVYCHSDGKNTMVASGNGHAPVWTTTFAALGGDRCAKCHGNSPQTSAHDAHQVGIHYNNIYNGTSGKLAAGASGSSSHGVAGQSTTITCNICHNKTMTAAANDQNALCNTCHTKGVNGALVKGNAKIADFSFHVNGKKEIAFLPSLKVVSKAQLRQTSFSNYSGLWVRNGGNYKNGVNAFDTAKTAFADNMWNSTAGTCSNISCHNLRVGEAVNWTDTTISCNSCHSKL
ncbi:CxxxxCH/CxxCH domain c-type cytochrome [Geotalea daltonii]|nr:CxxxxCH/CxxCH domain-containing protein [Geotalea daltonii]